MAEEVHETDGGTLYFDARKCIHSRNCVLERPDVFVPNVKGEWIHPERASSSELHMLEQNCPSGAIRFVEEGIAPAPILVNTLHIRENGPYALKAEIHMERFQDKWTRLSALRTRPNKDLEPGFVETKTEMALAGEEKPVTRMVLCRCGASKNKPYCDGSHTEAGFVASGEVATRKSEPLAARNGPLTVKQLKDGPLELEGNLEICTGTGRTVERTESAHLCRCGASKNKPFCDGSHIGIGFKTEG